MPYQNIHNEGGVNLEAYISTKQYLAEKNAWFSGKNEISRRSSSSEKKTGKRQKSFVRIIGRIGGLFFHVTDETFCPFHGRLGEYDMFAFRRVNRLKKNKSFQAVYKTGSSVVERGGVLYWTKRSGQPKKIGFAVGKKLGHAVIRNRIKRLMREVFRLHQQKLPEEVDLIFVARRPLVGAGFKQAEAVFLRLCRRAGLLREAR